VDPNPQATLEFTPDPNNQWRFINGPAGSDLYATVIHEIGHTLGWICGTASCGRGTDNPNYDGLMVPAPGNFVNGTTVNLVNGVVYNVPLRGDGVGTANQIVNELSHPGIAGDLMQGFGAAGQRETPSVIDVNLFLNTYIDTVNLPPTVNAGPDQTVECNTTGGANFTLDASGSTDPEGDTLTYSWTSTPAIALSGPTTATPSGFLPVGQTVTFRVDVTDTTDCNPDADTVVVTAVDTTAPVITCPGDVTIECDQLTEPSNTGSATAVDVCDSDPVVTFSDVVTPGACSQEETITRTWTATDASGNSDTCDQIITVVDTTAPVITCPGDVTIECDVDPIPANTGGSATATDNCDPNPVIIFSDAETPGSCPQEKTITRTWTATDACGNSSNCDQTITVVDTTPPVITCNAPDTIIPPDAPISFTATAIDNCDPNPTVVIVDPDCFKFTKKGKQIDKTESCEVQVDGDTITILNSGGVGDRIEWTVRATDACGNPATLTCGVDVVNPAK
jgi:hypothetical protein